MNDRTPFVSMDQVELKRGLEAEIRSILTRLSPPTRAGAQLILEGLGFSEEDYDGPLCDYADDEYNRLSATEQEDGGWRFWEDEAYGARLPRLSRMRRMLVAGLAVALLALGGCGSSPRVLNEGAAGPWRVTLSPVARTHADYAGTQTPGLTTVAWCDRQKQELRLSWGRTQGETIADSWHELGHRIEREYDEIWDILNAMDAPGFRCGSDDLHAAQREALRAEREAQ